MKQAVANNLDQRDDLEIELANSDEIVIAGADPSQISGQEEGRVLGLGCLDNDD